MNTVHDKAEIRISPLRPEQLDNAAKLMSLAFGTHLNVPEPLTFLGDIDFVHGRYRADPSAAFAATVNDRLVGAVFVSCWGSVAFFGPLIVHPEFWNKGIAQQLMHPVMECFERWEVQHAGLYTFSESTKHISLYQKFGFSPAYLRLLLRKEVKPAVRTEGSEAGMFSRLSGTARSEMLEACSALTSAIFAGLDVRREILAVADDKLGDTLLLNDAKGLAGFAVCHSGANTEAGSGRCYVKFAAVRSGDNAELRLVALLHSCEQFAARCNAGHLVAGVSVGRRRAYHLMLEFGFVLSQSGIAMHRPANDGYDRDDVFVLDDWR